MQQPLFRGAATAIITPFDETGVDVPALHRLVDFQIDNGISAIIACGTTGEPATMTADEKALTIEETVKAAKGRVPIICGTGTNNTSAVIEAEKRYRDLGCSAQLVVTPYYNKTTTEGLYAHFMHIAEHTELPIILYDVPSRTNMELMPETLHKLSQCEKFIGLKESSYQIPLIMEKISAMGGRIPLYSGNDDTIYPLLTMGAQGVISVMSNIAPKRVSDMVADYFAGDTNKCFQSQLDLMPLVRALFAEVNPIPVKHAAMKMGLCNGSLRLPLVSASEAVQKQLETAMQALL